MNKISYAITVCNEIDELTKLLNFLQLHIREDDEIVIQYDTNTATKEVKDYLKIVEKLHTNHKVIDFPLNKDFASFKNNLKRADIHEGIPFNIKFDLISCSHTLEHCHNPDLVIDIIKNSLVDEGFYWGQVPLDKESNINNHAPHYCQFESHDEHIDFIKSKGFKIIMDKKDSKQSILLAKKIQL